MTVRRRNEGEIRIPSGCAISAIINRAGVRFSGMAIADSLAMMHDRSNGLGGGFAGYGIYPECADAYCMHLLFEDEVARNEVVHNGEISSYGTNRRYLESMGYEVTLQTDTEVITYAIDLLTRRHGLPLDIAAKVLAPPFWDEIETLPDDEREFLSSLRIVYGSLLLNGPFSIIVGFPGGIMALNDRIKLRPLVVAEKGDFTFMASEESAIRAVSTDVERVWHPRGGEPVLVEVNSSPGASADSDPDDLLREEIA